MTTTRARPHTRALVPVEPAATDPPVLADHYIHAIKDAVKASHAPATRRSYEEGFARFKAWAEAEGLPYLPASPETVAAFLVHRAPGRSPSTLRIERTAIAHRHREADLADPCASEGVRRTLAGLVRIAATNGYTIKQARPLRAEDLAAIRATAKGARGRENVALVSVMRDALLRRSEAVAIRWADIIFEDDGSARVTIRRSKTDQDGAGVTVYLGRAAVRDLQAMMPEGTDPSPGDRVFPFTARTASRRIKAACRAAGLGAGFSGHSPRVGMAQDLAAHGVELPALMTAGRWSSSAMPARYCRGEAAGRGAVARYHGEAP